MSNFNPYSLRYSLLVSNGNFIKISISALPASQVPLATEPTRTAVAGTSSSFALSLITLIS